MNNMIFHSLTINKVEQLTKESTLLGFHVPAELKDDFAFEPGQYLTLKSLDKTVRRPYSICTSKNSDSLSVAVKHQEGGAFSSQVKNLKVGDHLEVMTPKGQFILNAKSKGKKHLFIAAGSGITPILSMMETILQQDPDCFVTLLFGNKNMHEIMFIEKIGNLKNSYLKNVQLLHFMSQEVTDVPLLHGRIDRNKLSLLEHSKMVPITSYDTYYLCGPVNMTEDIIDWLIEQSIDEKNIKKEVFVPKKRLERQLLAQKKSNKTLLENATEIHFKLDGRSRQFLQNEGEMLLDAAKRHNIDLPHSCGTGMCATCRCRIVSGEAEMHENYSLEKGEIEKGFILSCQINPKSPTITLDFDDK